MKAYLKQWQNRAMASNITGHASMVAYSLLLSIFPFIFLLLLGVGLFMDTNALSAQLANLSQDLFPSLTEHDMAKALESTKEQNTGSSIIAILGSLWVASSLWSALDTAFARIYILPARSWPSQKMFALRMLLIQSLFVVLTIFMPTVQGLILSGINTLHIPTLFASELVLFFSALLLFIVFSFIYRSVPNYNASWHHIWPGASIAVTGIIIVNAIFPFYLSKISSLGSISGSVGFMLIVLLWFYLVALMILIGAVTNSLAHIKDEERKIAELEVITPEVES